MEIKIFETPIVVIVFNRPNLTAQVLEILREIKPKSLFLIGDGPRETALGESELCRQTREVFWGIDWDCEVKTNYSDVNLGCKLRVVSGLDWVFSQVESAIILEDDCLPDTSFFTFAADMLIRFQDDLSVGMISGNNYLFGLHEINESYYASKYPHIWGWATWKRAWQKYDPEICAWKDMNSEAKIQWHKGLQHGRGERAFWTKAFDAVSNNLIDTWDFQWVFTMFNSKMVSIVPRKNLVSNSGIGAQATHTNTITLESTAQKSSLSLPLEHPSGPISANKSADKIESKLLFNSLFIFRIFRWLFSRIRSNRLVRKLSLGNR